MMQQSITKGNRGDLVLSLSDETINNILPTNSLVYFKKRVQPNWIPADDFLKLLEALEKRCESSENEKLLEEIYKMKDRVMKGKAVSSNCAVKGLNNVVRYYQIFMYFEDIFSHECHNRGCYYDAHRNKS